jgi:uncharacterized OB-fold protein
MTRYLGDDFMLPVLHRHNTPFYTAGTIQIQCCDDCDHAQHPPDDVCYNCQGTNLGFRAMSGEGRVESAVLVHHPIHPGLKDKVPYVIAVISVDGAPGCNVIGNVLGCPAEDVAIGQKVQAIFDEVQDPNSDQRMLIPNWELAGN